MFIVWERNGGYIGVSCYEPRSWKTTDGRIFTFKTLATFKDWTQDVLGLINEKHNNSIERRNKSPLVKMSW